MRGFDLALGWGCRAFIEDRSLSVSTLLIADKGRLALIAWMDGHATTTVHRESAMFRELTNLIDGPGPPKLDTPRPSSSDHGPPIWGTPTLDIPGHR